MPQRVITHCALSPSVKDRDGYRRILDSYEQEMSANRPSGAGTARIRHLEDSLQSYRNQNTTLEMQLEQAAIQRADADTKIVNVSQGRDGSTALVVSLWAA